MDNVLGAWSKWGVFIKRWGAASKS